MRKPSLFLVLMLNCELCINDPLCLFLAYIIIKLGSALTELCLLGSKNTNSIRIKMAIKESP